MEITFETYSKVNGSNFIRMANYDAPEMNTAAGRRAKEALKRKIQNKVVTLIPRGKSYGRTVSDVRYKKKKLNKRR